MKTFWLLLFIPALLIACPDPSKPTLTDDEKVRQALNLTLAAKHYRIHATALTEVPGLDDTKYDIEYVAPDRYHVVFSNISAEVIVIGNQIWGKGSGEAWKALGTPNPDPRQLSRPIKAEDIVGFKAERYTASLNCDNYIQGDPTSLFIRVCVDRVSGRVTYINLSDDTGGIDNVYDYQTTITINAPI